MPELVRVGRALRRRWWLVLAAAVVGALAGAVSAEATGGPAWVTTASIRLEADTVLPVADGGRPIDLLPLQSVVDATMASSVSGIDASAAVARAADTDTRRTVHITVSAPSAEKARAGLDAYVEQFRTALQSVQARWRANASAVLDAAGASGAGPVIAALRAVVDEVGTADLIVAVDIDPPQAPTNTAAVAALAALALAALTAAAVALLVSEDRGAGSGRSAHDGRDGAADET
jgi:hypothetical protein